MVKKQDLTQKEQLAIDIITAILAAITIIIATTWILPAPYRESMQYGVLGAMAMRIIMKTEEYEKKRKEQKQDYHQIKQKLKLP